MIRKTILMLLLAVFSTTAAADWFPVGGNENGTIYTDPATINKEGDIVSMWDLLDFKSVQVTTLGKKFLSQMSHHELDCKEKRGRLLETTIYSGNAESGEVIYRDISSGQWESLKPESVLQILWNIACGQN